MALQEILLVCKITHYMNVLVVWYKLKRRELIIEMKSKALSSLWFNISTRIYWENVFSFFGNYSSFRVSVFSENI